MKRFVEGLDRAQGTLFPERLEDWISEDNPVRVVDVFVDELDLGGLGFGRVEPQATGRPGYHPCVLLKLYIYGYLNRVQSSRRLEREAGRNVEVMWLTGRLAPDHKTIADFRPCAASWISSPRPAWRSMDPSSRRPTPGTGTSRRPR
jgi:transposase